jgi:hypothetical protein
MAYILVKYVVEHIRIRLVPGERLKRKRRYESLSVFCHYDPHGNVLFYKEPCKFSGLVRRYAA